MLTQVLDSITQRFSWINCFSRSVKQDSRPTVWASQMSAFADDSEWPHPLVVYRLASLETINRFNSGFLRTADMFKQQGIRFIRLNAASGDLPLHLNPDVRLRALLENELPFEGDISEFLVFDRRGQLLWQLKGSLALKSLDILLGLIVPGSHRIEVDTFKRAKPELCPVK